MRAARPVPSTVLALVVAIVALVFAVSAAIAAAPPWSLAERASAGHREPGAGTIGTGLGQVSRAGTHGGPRVSLRRAPSPVDAAPPRPLGLDAWVTLLLEPFDGIWPAGSTWRAFDDNGAEGGQYFWANRCVGVGNLGRSAWAIGGGADGQLFTQCNATYPDHLESWMIAGPLNLAGARAARMDFTMWLNSECLGTDCATKADRLWALASSDGASFDGRWWAGDWKDDPRSGPGGWYETSLDLVDHLGEDEVWVGFLFETDGSIGYPGGAFVDDVEVQADRVCNVTASIRSLTTDRNCYVPGAQIGVLVDVASSMASQWVKAEITLWSGDVIWVSAEETFTAPGQQVIPLAIPDNLFPGDYRVVARILDADQPDCIQDARELPIRIDPQCGTVTPPAATTAPPTATHTPTRTATPTPTLAATLCPGQSVHETKQVFIPSAPARADVLFVFDTTGSMGPVLSSAKANAVAIMNDLNQVIPDIQFGVVDLRDYPLSPFGETGDWPYLLRQSITSERVAVAAAIAAMNADGGDDRPEAYARALYESGADPAIGWRADSRRFVLMFGDDVPHDDDLNARIASPPVNPGGTWCGDTTAGCVRDPGRDGLPGTGDDLDFQAVLDGMRAQHATLLHVVSGNGSTSQANLVTYWKQWASWTNSGGDAVPLADAASLPSVIVSLITSAGSRISRLEPRTVPSSYQSWIVANPPAYTDLEIPPGGRTVSFEIDIRVPEGTAPGDHNFEVKVVGDGAVYGGQGVRIRVPASCATPTATRTQAVPPTVTPTLTPYPCPPVRPPVTPSCDAPNVLRNAAFELGSRSWAEWSTAGRELVGSAGALEGFYSAHLEGSPGHPTDELLYQVFTVPVDATAASFWVDHLRRELTAVSPPPARGGDYFRASLYDATLTTELVRLWTFDPLLPLACGVDASTVNLSPGQLDLVRGRTVALVLRLSKVTPGWRAAVWLDGLHFTICAPPPPCRVLGDKSAVPAAVPPGGEVTVHISLTGLDGMCLPARQPVDVALVLDSSGSMVGQPLDDAKAAAKQFLDRIDPSTDQAASISFSDSASVDQVLTANIGPLRGAIDGLTAGGGTNIADGIARGQAELESPRHKPANARVMVLLSDGRPTAGGDPRAAADAAKAAGLRIFTIGLGNEIDPELMRALASIPSNFYFAPDSGALDAIYEQIAGVIGGSPATNITIVDRLSPQVTLVPGSFTGPRSPEISPDGRTLTWRIPRLGLETLHFSYRVRMTTTPGNWPTNSSATVTYTGSNGQPGGFSLPEPMVQVMPPASTGHPDAMCRDHSGDNGSTPSNPAGQAWWDSPDIWVRNAPDGGAEHQNPIAGQANTLYVRVRNIGTRALEDITVHVYDSAGATNILWPDDWAPEIGRASIRRLDAAGSTVVSISWVPPYTGHYCFLVRLEADEDPIRADGWVPFDNNLCQKNLQILEEPAVPGVTGAGVGIGNRNRGSGYGRIRLSAPSFPASGAGRLTFSDPGLFDRWQNAGGTATGGTVDVRGRSIGFGGPGSGTGGVAVTLDRVPFAGDETARLQVELTLPPGAAAPPMHVEQEMNGSAVGGAFLRPTVRGGIYLPITTKSAALGGRTALGPAAIRWLVEAVGWE